MVHQLLQFLLVRLVQGALGGGEVDPSHQGAPLGPAGLPSLRVAPARPLFEQGALRRGAQGTGSAAALTGGANAAPGVVAVLAGGASLSGLHGVLLLAFSAVESLAVRRPRELEPL